MFASIIIIIGIVIAVLITSWAIHWLIETWVSNRDFQQNMKAGDHCIYDDGYDKFHCVILSFNVWGVVIKNEYDLILTVSKNELYV